MLILHVNVAIWEALFLKASDVQNWRNWKQAKNSSLIVSTTQGRRSLWDRGDTSPQYLDRGDMITNVPPQYF